MVNVGVVIAAGGRGRRFGGGTPKQFLRLNGVPILQRSIELFDSFPSVNEIVVVSPRNEISRVERLLGRMGSGKILTIVAGGRERQDSVWNGLNAFVGKPHVVLVHDAVRPLVSRKTIAAVIASTVRYRAAVVGVRIVDTIKLEGREGFYIRTLERNKLWAVQTPQGFRFDLLVSAHKAARRSSYLGTDEASLLERLRIPVRIVEGDSRNIKITTPEDLRLAEMWLKKPRG
jgi:2-C-methyl-D-erythritol 4-phosphate cytidylyltransferase